ncbi:MAG: hypothetical protein LBV69_05120 [Bacteroidales bacterium]|nr:hypothetical protein [Bacteroidales bacterium]
MTYDSLVANYSIHAGGEISSSGIVPTSHLYVKFVVQDTAQYNYLLV